MSAYDFRRMTLCHVTVTTFIPLLLTVVFNCESLSIGFPQDWSSDWPISTSNVEHIGEGLRHTNGCQFPEHWMGNWFQKGVQDPIRIINGTLSNKGDCRDSDGDKFLIESWNEKCYRCVVMHEKHENVLQYKESYCSPINQFQSLGLLCEEINGDALLFSMFRLGSAPVGCPFSGPFTFTYRRDSGECANPVSSIDSCTDDSRLLFRFQACANVMSSESRVEELVCLAWWKEGSTRYVVGKLQHKEAKTDDDKFRCFVYEKVKDHGYLLSQSGDATCDGLFTASEGSRTMRLTRTNHPHARCQFPEWVTSGRHWKTLDAKQTYDFSHRNTSYHVTNTSNGRMHMRVVCIRDDYRSDSNAQMVVHVTSGCNIGYVCLRIHKRAKHVIELQMGKIASHVAESCNSLYFDSFNSEYVTVTTSNSESGECPLVGIYTTEGSNSLLIHVDTPDLDTLSCSHDSILASGCSAVDQLELLEECASERRVTKFQCRGSWEENGTYYLIATAKETRKHYCITYTEKDKVLHFSGSTETCLRNIGIENFVVFNVTNSGLCMDTNGATRHPDLTSWISSLIFFLILTLTSKCGSR
ncbi:uncharacterized protein [Centruroides vittatus]|uniref:uncharacterized protein isoform X1 n=2 Tax=Centruroides vittatus TaxID=120091 RepID=UPI0035102A37